jgi:plastocyanin
MRRWCFAAWFVSLFAIALVLPARPARADGAPPDSWDVLVGGDNPDAAITTYAYWPAVLTIHSGDTVRWSFVSGLEHHTVSFLSSGPPPAAYVPGPGSDEYTLGPAWYPIGTIAAKGTFDGSEDASSGAMFGADHPAFSLTFPTAGTYSYLCLLHPGMQGVVSVVDAGATLKETPDQARIRGQNALDGRIAALRDRIAPPKDGVVLAATAPSSAVVPRTVHAIHIGTSDVGVGALRFFPADVTVRRGEIVFWTNSGVYAGHTVTLLSGNPQPGALTVRQSGPPLLTLAASVVVPTGGDSYDGQSYMNSGILAPAASYALTIDAPPGAYEYVCLLHPDAMKGSITVVDDTQ